ncbi:CDP-alcohol phosphatidyltransferase [Nocardioides terrae]|uniref:CDP-alcohol phosphatidyltransferase n=1 Tax=Nocardioides terrae TaxID=574651 RepID=A0A1I1HTH0_9ACTN|nr:CDP-alcohol phosphatidyltransferase family protein [Nocardioides terrae]SFC27095.1 CDP-alcohol phosphatidyltransferase [Nocardioides terrae]
MTTVSATHARTFRANLAELRAAQKPSSGTAAYGRYVNRPAGRVVAAACHRIGLTPDQATAVSAALSGAGIALLAVSSPSWGPLVAVLLAFGYVMDSVDGQLARLRGRGSLRGEWLDHTVDCFKTSSLHLAVAIAWFRFPPADDHRVLLIPLAFSVVQSVTYFGLILVPFLRATRDPTRATPRTEHPLRKWLILPTDYGALIWLFVLTPWPEVFLPTYTTLLVLAAAMLGLALRKWWLELTDPADTSVANGG